MKFWQWYWRAFVIGFVIIAPLETLNLLLVHSWLTWLIEAAIILGAAVASYLLQRKFLPIRPTLTLVKGRQDRERSWLS
jgi:hypothetical protein